MNYQITCICGNRFLIPEDHLARPVSCPACKRSLMPVAPPASSDAPPAMPSAASAPADPTKRCPFCGEVILAIAKKCKHCNEFLDRAAPATAAPAQQRFPAPASAAAIDPAADPAPVYALTVSQWDNFWRFLICICLAILIAAAFVYLDPLKPYTRIGVAATVVLAAIVMALFYLAVRNTRCFVRPTRIDTETGILSKDLNSIELFRIADIELQQNFLERLLRIGTIKVFSTDTTTPELILYQIPRPREVYKYLQNQIPLAAKQRGAMYLEK